MARRTAGEAKFSLAISWIVVFWRSSSLAMTAKSSSSGSVSEGHIAGGLRGAPSEFLFQGTDLGHPPRVTTPSNAVVRKVRRIISARPTPTTRAPIASTLASLCSRANRAMNRSLQRAAHPSTLLAEGPLPLAAATDHDADIGLPVPHGPTDGRAVDRVVDRRLAVRPEVRDLVPVGREQGDEVLLEQEPGMVGADGDPGHRSSVVTAGPEVALFYGRGLLGVAGDEATAAEHPQEMGRQQPPEGDRAPRSSAGTRRRTRPSRREGRPARRATRRRPTSSGARRRCCAGQEAGPRRGRTPPTGPAPRS